MISKTMAAVVDRIVPLKAAQYFRKMPFGVIVCSRDRLEDFARVVAFQAIAEIGRSEMMGYSAERTKQQIQERLQKNAERLTTSKPGAKTETSKEVSRPGRGRTITNHP